MIDAAWAQGAGGGPPALVSFLPLLLVFVVFYFLLIRPQQQKAKEHTTMLSNLRRNDEVVTAGGLFGKIVTLADRVVTLEIAPNVRVRVARDQISALASTTSSDDKEKGKDKKDRS